MTDRQPGTPADPSAEPLTSGQLTDITTQGTGDIASGPPTPPSGGGQIRRIGSQTAIYAAGVLIGRAVSFLLLPLYTRYLSPADYGVIQLIELAFDVLTLVAGARLASGVYYFYFKAETDAERHELRSTATLTVTLGYLAVGLIAFLAAPALSRLLFNDERFTTVIQVAAACFPLQGLVIVPLLIIKAREQPRYFVTLTTGRLLGQAALNVFFLVVLDLGVVSMFLSTLVTSALVATWLIVEQLREGKPRFSMPVLRSLARYGLPLMATHVATLFVAFGDRFFLQRAGDQASPGVALAGETAVGLYALAYQFGFLLMSVGVEPFSSVWNPVRFDLAKRADRDVLFSNAFLLLNLMVITIAVGIALFAQDVIRLLAAPAFHPSGQLVPIILLAYVFQAWSSAQDTGIRITERTGLDALANWISALVALIGYLVLIPRYVGFGAAWATVFALAVRHAIIYGVSQRLWPVKYDWAPIMRLMLLAVGLTLIRVFLPRQQLVPSIATATLLFAVYVAGLFQLRIIPNAWRRSMGKLARQPREAFLALVGTRG